MPLQAGRCCTFAAANQPCLPSISPHSWFDSAGDGLDQGLYYAEPESQLSTLAQFYDIPVLSVRAAVWRLMAAGTRHFKVRRKSWAGACGRMCELEHLPRAPGCRQNAACHASRSL